MYGDHDFRYFQYDLPNGNRVFLTNRPDVCKKEQVMSFIETWNPDVRFMFTDDSGPFDAVPVNIPTHWIPWVPGWDLRLENIFVFLSLMNHYNQTQCTIWLHCDSSSMRAPTFFGLYLEAVYPTEVSEIVKPLKDYEKEINQRRWGHPDEYAQTSFDLDSDTKELIMAWRNGGEKAAHTWIMEHSWEKK